MGDCILGYYGKLPLSPEFIRYNTAADEVYQLDQWIQEGMSHAIRVLGTAWKEDFAKAVPWNFLFFPPGGRRFLVGAGIPTQDQAGRHFPFFLFLIVDRQRFCSPTYLAPRYFSPFLRLSMNALLTGWQGVDLKGFRELLDRLPLPSLADSASAEEDYGRYVRQHTVRQFLTDLAGDSGQVIKSGLMQNLKNCLEPLREQSATRLAWSFKLPLMLSEHEPYDIAVWHDLIARAFGRRIEPAMLLWNRQPAHRAPGLLTTFSRPFAQNFLFLLRPDLNRDSWYDPGTNNVGRQDAIGDTKVSEQESDRGAELSLHAFLARIDEGQRLNSGPS